MGAPLFDRVPPDGQEGLLALGWRRVPRDRAHGWGDWMRPDGSIVTESEAREHWERLQKDPPPWEEAT